MVSDRYGRGSMILSSNKRYGDWGTIFQDNLIASVILGRLLHHATTSTLRTKAIG